MQFQIPTPKMIKSWGLKRLQMEYRVLVRVLLDVRAANERQQGEITSLRAENADLRTSSQRQTENYSELNQKYWTLFNEINKEKDATKKQVRVLRLVEFAGEREAVEQQVRQSIHGTVDVRNGAVIVTAVTLHEYPEILQVARMAPSVLVQTDNSQDGTAAKGNATFDRNRR